jgi:uncharacterized protein YbaR (Trm112 family)
MATTAVRTGKRDGDPAGEAAPQLLEFLVCPLTHTTLEYDRKRRELVSHAARLAFPIRDGVPVMLVSEARKLQK